MPKPTAEIITGYLDTIKWSYRVINPSHVVTVYRCPVPAYYYTVGVETTINEYWVTVRALLQQNIDRAHLPTVLRLLAEWNTASYRARFLLVGDCAVVQAEIPTVQLSADEYLLALSSVCRYSTLAGVEIAAVATNPSLRAKLDEVVEHTTVTRTDESTALLDLDLDFEITPNQLPD